jgi:SH3-like domain-containing protein
MILDAIRPTQVPVVLTPLVCTKFFQVTVDAANLRQGPGKQYKVVRVARKGENLEVTGQRSPAGWYPVRDTVGKAYWVSADLGKVLERNCRLP